MSKRNEEMSNTKQEPIRKVMKSGDYEEEYFLCPKCNHELEYGEQIIDAMYDDIVPAGEAEVDFLYCPDSGIYSRMQESVILFQRGKKNIYEVF